MNGLVYIMIGFFVFGGSIMYWINKDRPTIDKRNSLVKYISYFGIVSMMIFVINYLPRYIVYLFGILIFIGLYELVKTYIYSDEKPTLYFVIALMVYAMISIVFIQFSLLSPKYILFTYLVVVVFDAFSQLIGQLVGSTQLFPVVSPNKTIEGLIGGIMFSLVFVFVLNTYLVENLSSMLIGSLVISFTAVVGDFLASVFKRRFGVKDFSNLIPQHGGILDRFDSFILAGSSMYLLILLMR